MVGERGSLYAFRIQGGNMKTKIITAIALMSAYMPAFAASEESQIECVKAVLRNLGAL